MGCVHIDAASYIIGMYLFISHFLISSFTKKYFAVSATIFLYFACILPAIAFGNLNYQNTGVPAFK